MLHMTSKRRRTAAGNKSVTAQQTPESDENGSKFLEKLVTRLVRKDIIPPPRTFLRGNNVDGHLHTVEKYLHSMDIADNQSKCAILWNSLEDAVALEVRAQPGAVKHEDDFYWLCCCLQTLYQSKRTEAAPVIHLFNIKQKADQSLEDFVKEMRVEAYKTMNGVDEERKEELLLKGFIKGMRERQIADALKALKPQNLSQAIKIAKSEQKRQHEYYHPHTENIRAAVIKSPNEKSEIDELKEQVKQMQFQLNRILHFVQKIDSQNVSIFPPKISGVNFQSRQTVGNNKIQIQRARPPPICYNCNKSGHFARQCPENRRFPQRPYGNVRHLTEEADKAVSETSNNPEDDTISNGSEGRNCFVIDAPRIQATVTKHKIRAHPKSKLESECDGWVDYIYGRGSRPKTAPTLISNSRSEPASNKPLVKAKCEDSETNIFLDTGAETNVMDSTYFRELQKRNPHLTLTPSKQIIRCANGSRMTPIGTTFVQISFKHVNTVAKFTVVDDLFPRVIVGIRTMKGVSLILEPNRDLARIGNITLPFLSKVTAPSVFGNSGKEGRFVSRVGSELKVLH
jgi:hypothetical protein